MGITVQLRLITERDLGVAPPDWTFNGASTREFTHCYHDYPARMIPQIAGKLLDMFAPTEARLLFDPYCGTGTSLVEASLRGLNAIGTDLNPLARLIAHAKTSVPDTGILDAEISRLRRMATRHSSPNPSLSMSPINGIDRLDFWFKPQVILLLNELRQFISSIEEPCVRLFFQVAFSETVRESSNTRNNEFKLYRYDDATLEKLNPDVLGIMLSKLKRNRAGLARYEPIIRNFKSPTEVLVHDFDTVHGIPAEILPPASADIVITSPPYGDSHTTVAYGQYCRLSSAWLGLPDPEKVDRRLMGGKPNKKIPVFPCDSLNHALGEISRIDEKRALEVSSFYSDLLASIHNVSHVIKTGGYSCYVVGNRKVKGVVLPTDEAVRCFFEHFGFIHIDSFSRSIPNKRMPLRNSPSNAPGAVDSTMVRERIVVMRRELNQSIRERATPYLRRKKKGTGERSRLNKPRASSRVMIRRK